MRSVPAVSGSRLSSRADAPRRSSTRIRRARRRPAARSGAAGPAGRAPAPAASPMPACAAPPVAQPGMASPGLRSAGRTGRALPLSLPAEADEAAAGARRATSSALATSAPKTRREGRKKGMPGRGMPGMNIPFAAAPRPSPTSQCRTSLTAEKLLASSCRPEAQRAGGRPEREGPPPRDRRRPLKAQQSAIPFPPPSQSLHPGKGPLASSRQRERDSLSLREKVPSPKGPLA